MNISVAWSLLNVDWPAVIAAAIAGFGWIGLQRWRRRR